MPKGKTGNPRGRPPGAVGQGKSLRLYQDAAAHALRPLVGTATEAALLANKIVRGDAKCWAEFSSTGALVQAIKAAPPPQFSDPMNETKNTLQRLTGSAKINGLELAYEGRQAEWLANSVYLLEVILRGKTRGVAAVAAKVLMADCGWPRPIAERFFEIAAILHSQSNAYWDVERLDDVDPVFRLPTLIGGD